MQKLLNVLSVCLAFSLIIFTSLLSPESLETSAQQCVNSVSISLVRYVGAALCIQFSNSVRARGNYKSVCKQSNKRKLGKKQLFC